MPRAKEHDASSQLVTFQRWWNSYLEPRGLPVTDLLSQIGDGYLGFRLLEALEGLPAAPVQRGKAKIMGVSVVAKPAVLMQKMDNLNNLLEVLMTTKGVKVRAAHGALIPARHICPHARGPGSVAAPSSAALRLAPRRRRFARLCLWLLWTSVRGLSSA